ncbi:MAG: hypothetical protein ACMUIG_01125 [Thermoplasmatota archaeon]
MDQEQIAPVIREIKAALEDMDEQNIESELKKYLQYGIVLQEAKKAIIKKHGGKSASYPSLGEKKLKDLKGNEMNLDLTVKCLSSRETMKTTSNGDKIMISGLVADDTMIRRFVSWDGLNLEKGKVYHLKSVNARTYRGEVEINLGSFSDAREAKDGVLSDLDASKLPRFGSLREMDLRDIRPGMGNVKISAKVLSVESRQIETDSGPKTIYDGVLSDGTKRMRFTSWHDFKLKTEDVVSIVGAYVKEWRGIPQINFDDRAEVEFLDDVDFDVLETPRFTAEELLEAGASDVEVAGTIIEIRDGSGLIFRCPSCNRALMNGSCSIHGNQEGIPDLRAKVVLDDGTGALFAVLNTEITEEILCMNVGECVEKFQDMGEERIVELLGQMLLGKDYILRGNVIRDDFGPTVLPSTAVPERAEYLDEARSLIKEMEGF